VQTSDTGILPDRLNAEAQSSQRFAEKTQNLDKLEWE
jgi:hypothetical protein